MDETKTALVYVVDDQELARTALARLVESVGLEFRAFESPSEFLDAYDPDRPGCVVLDLRLPGMSGIEVQERLAAAGRGTPVIIVTGHADVSSAVRAMKAGAVDFVEKPVNEQEFLDRVQRCVAQDLARRQESDDERVLLSRLKTLTPRERDVLHLVIAGKSSKEVARDLGLSPKTVEVHRGNLMQKMAVRSAVDLARIASKLGF